MPERPGAPFTEFIGALLDEAGEGYPRLILKCGPRHLGLDGHVHGGVLTTLMDSSIGIAISRLRGEAERRRAPHATIEMNTTFFAQAAEGDDLVVEGRITMSTDTVITGESEARLADGRVLARGRLTFAIIHREA
jgi:uncharacterized protein (TIGR00369 family)